MINAILGLIIATLLLIIVMLAIEYIRVKGERDIYYRELLSDFENPEYLTVIGFNASDEEIRR